MKKVIHMEFKRGENNPIEAQTQEQFTGVC